MNKLAVILAAAMLTLTLGGCGHTHQWQEATCAAPKTCAECGETEGEPLAHTWQEATCSAPKTCSACGATEGTALEHQLGEATYQSPAVCSVCGAEVGEPLPAAFAGHTFMELDKDYEYLSCPPSNSNAEIKGTVRMENYRVVESDATHEAKEGYEWRIAEAYISFDDENARLFGYDGRWIWADYYTGGGDDSNALVFQGKEFHPVTSATILENGWTSTGVANIRLQCECQVPAGYDGVIFSLVSPKDIDSLVSPKDPGGVVNETDYLINMDGMNSVHPLLFRLA